MDGMEVWERRVGGDSELWPKNGTGGAAISCEVNAVGRGGFGEE